MHGLLTPTRLLIDWGADIASEDDLGRSPLFLSCMLGQSGCAQLMLRAGAAVDQPMGEPNPGATPLYVSALHGHLDCARLLCDAGANVNAACNQGATPFFASCQEGHLGVAKLLSSHGAELHYENPAGMLCSAASDGGWDGVRVDTVRVDMAPAACRTGPSQDCSGSRCG